MGSCLAAAGQLLEGLSALGWLGLGFWSSSRGCGFFERANGCLPYTHQVPSS